MDDGEEVTQCWNPALEANFVMQPLRNFCLSTPAISLFLRGPNPVVVYILGVPIYSYVEHNYIEVVYSLIIVESIFIIFVFIWLAFK